MNKHLALRNVRRRKRQMQLLADVNPYTLPPKRMKLILDEHSIRMKDMIGKAVKDCALAQSQQTGDVS